VNVVSGFRVTDRHDDRAQKAGGIETLFAVVIAGIFLGDRWPVEHLRCIGEIKAVFLQIGRALGGFPSEVHKLLYIRIYILQGAGEAAGNFCVNRPSR